MVHIDLIKVLKYLKFIFLITKFFNSMAAFLWGDPGPDQ